MLDTVNMRAYERYIVKSLLSNGIDENRVEVLMRDFYPVVYNIFRGEVDPEQYVGMLDSISERNMTIEDVRRIVFGKKRKTRPKFGLRGYMVKSKGIRVTKKNPKLIRA